MAEFLTRIEGRRFESQPLCGVVSLCTLWHQRVLLQHKTHHTMANSINGRRSVNKLTVKDHCISFMAKTRRQQSILLQGLYGGELSAAAFREMAISYVAC